MVTRSWSEEHSRAVAAAAPDVGAASQEELDQAWARIEPAMVDDRRRSRRRAWVVVGGGIAAVVLAAGGVAAAAVYSAHTGRGPVDTEDVRLGGPGERLDPAAPDYAQVLADSIGDVPFPTARDRDAYVSAEVAADSRGASPGATLVSTGALRYWAARSAVCFWADQWAAAAQAGDPVAKRQAAAMLDQAPSWPAVTDVDAEQTSRTAAGYFPLLRDAVRADDVAALARVLRRDGACDAYGAAMPDLPQAIAGPGRSE